MPRRWPPSAATGRSCSAASSPPPRSARWRKAERPSGNAGIARGARLRARPMTQRSDQDSPDDRPIESRDDLLSVFAKGEKPRDEWRIGTEHEKFVYRCGDHRAPSWEEAGGIRD